MKTKFEEAWVGIKTVKNRLLPVFEIYFYGIVNFSLYGQNRLTDGATWFWAKFSRNCDLLPISYWAASLYPVLSLVKREIRRLEIRIFDIRKKI
jgi:hypothetical protein